MSRASAVAVLTALVLAAAPARADGPAKPPDAARVRTAAAQFDAGMAAMKAKDFEGAASCFEAADAAVASPNALRQAIRARDKAGQGSRAATLAALALDRYPSDEPTAKLAKETIEKYEPLLHKLSVSCASPCVLAIGTRSVPGDPNTRWTVYLDPRKEQLGASFFGGAASAPREVTGKAGGAESIRFEPFEPAAKPPALPPPPPKADPEPPKKDPDPPPADEPTASPKGISPVFFGVGAAATVGLGATLVWSAVDTQTNPGPDKVREACAGKGESCALFQEALSKQKRTNILIGATAGTAAVTVVLAVFTRWRSPKPAAPASASSSAGGPRLGFTWAPTAAFLERGAVLGAAGAF